MSWKKKKNLDICEDVSDDELWEAFNSVFFDYSSKKTSTYKFGLIKSILDNLFNASKDYYWNITYSDIFSKFSENYWNLIVKYRIRQMSYNGKSEFSQIESIFYEAINNNPALEKIEFSSIEEKERERIVKKVSQQCRRNVVGALCGDLKGIVYKFDISRDSQLDGLFFSDKVYEFLTKYKVELEKLNYFAWAQKLEKINSEELCTKLLEKLELATPKRADLSIYREVLRLEFEENNCFYCGKKLSTNVHVDHYIPWRFVKEDNLWNMVLTCSKCNLLKNCRLPAEETIARLEIRNTKARKVDNSFVVYQFRNYEVGLLDKMWRYAHMSGYREWKN